MQNDKVFVGAAWAGIIGLPIALVSAVITYLSYNPKIEKVTEVKKDTVFVPIVTKDIVSSTTLTNIGSNQPENKTKEIIRIKKAKSTFTPKIKSKSKWVIVNGSKGTNDNLSSSNPTPY